VSHRNFAVRREGFIRRPAARRAAATNDRGLLLPWARAPRSSCTDLLWDWPRTFAGPVQWSQTGQTPDLYLVSRQDYESLDLGPANQE
jgi:hypothetical protein